MRKDPAGRQVNDTGTAGVIARPPLQFLAALLLGVASDHLFPLPFAVPEGGWVRAIVAGSLILIGLALAATGIRNFPARQRRYLRTGPPVRW